MTFEQLKRVQEIQAKLISMEQIDELELRELLLLLIEDYIDRGYP